MENCLEADSWDGHPIVYPEQNRKSHESKHPEVKDLKFINGRVKETINQPDFVYKDIDNKSKINAYKKEYECNGISRYTKVVIEITKETWTVITAYRPTYVKEKGKSDLVYGKHE